MHHRWAKLVPKATWAHNALAHEARVGNVDPNEAYELEHKNLQFELREEVGHKNAQLNAVFTRNQKNMEETGALRTYIGREDIRRRGDRPQYSGSVNRVSVVEGNRAKDSRGEVRNMTPIKPMPKASEQANITARVAGALKQKTENESSSKRMHDLCRRC